MIHIISISCDIALLWKPPSLLITSQHWVSRRWTMVLIMACCLTATSHYLNQCSSSYMASYGDDQNFRKYKTATLHPVNILPTDDPTQPYIMAFQLTFVFGATWTTFTSRASSWVERRESADDWNVNDDCMESYMSTSSKQRKTTSINLT